MKSIDLILLGVLLLGVPAENARGASLRVAPARFILQNVEPGREYDLYKEARLRLTLFNDEEVERTWIATTHRPSERGDWERGYAEIPNPSWCRFEETEIVVPAGDKAHAHLRLRIPDDDRYYNQNWVVTLGIGSGAGTGGVALAVDVRAQIETTALPDPEERPDGSFGATPSLVRFENVIPGERRESRVSIYNGTSSETVFGLNSLFTVEGIDRNTYLTSSYKQIPNPDWIDRPDKIAVSSEGQADFDVAVDVPDAPENYGKRWEDFVLIVPPEGRSRFFRVQIETIGKDEAKVAPNQG